jgi:hypothetical protein
MAALLAIVQSVFMLGFVLRMGACLWDDDLTGCVDDVKAGGNCR